MVRDIDDWIFHFEKRAAPRLKQIFEQDLGGTPTKIIQQLERLRQVEQRLLKNNKK